MLPNVLQPNATDHVPVLAAEVRASLGVQPGDTVVDATFGAGGHAALLADDLQGTRQADRDRPRSDGAHVLRALREAGTRAGAPAPRRLRRRPAAAGGERRARRRDPARPRRLVHAGRPAGARFLVRDRRAARHADGHLAGADRRRDRQRVARAGADDHLPPVRRGAVREADRARDRPAAQGAAVRAHGRAGGHDQELDPGAGAVRRGTSGEARLPGIADRRERRAARARGGAAGGARDAAARRPARGHLVPLARGPDRQAVLPREGEGLHVPAGLPHLRVRARARAAGRSAAAGPAGRGRDRRESALRVGTAARRDQGRRPGGRDRTDGRRRLVRLGRDRGTRALPAAACAEGCSRRRSAAPGPGGPPRRRLDRLDLRLRRAAGRRRRASTSRCCARTST